MSMFSEHNDPQVELEQEFLHRVNSSAVLDVLSHRNIRQHFLSFLILKYVQNTLR